LSKNGKLLVFKKGKFSEFFFLTTGVSTFSIKLKADKAIMVKGGETGLERRDLGEKKKMKVLTNRNN